MSYFVKKVEEDKKKQQHPPSAGSRIKPGLTRELSEDMQWEIKRELQFPALKTLDPVTYIARYFQEHFTPRNSLFREYMSAKSENPAAGRKFYRKFSHLCFERGFLASAVLEGEGRVLLLAAIRRSLGFSGIPAVKSDVLEIPSAVESKEGSSATLYNDLSKGAFALTADASAGASRALEALKSAIEEDRMVKKEHKVLLQSVLPYLSVKKEYSMLEAYQLKLSELRRILQQSPEGGPDMESGDMLRTQVHLLEDAISTLRQIIHKKKQLRLRLLSLLDDAWKKMKRFDAEIEKQPATAAEILSSTGASGSEDGSGENKPQADESDKKQPEEGAE